MRVEPQRVEGLHHTARLRDLEDREPAAGTQHAAQLAQRELEVGDVAHAEADGRRVERRVLERQREHVALHPVERRLAARPREHLLREVEARDAAGAGLRVGDREVARAARRVEHAVALPYDRGGGERRQRTSRPAVMTRFIAS